MRAHSGPYFEQLTVFDGVAISFCNSENRKEQFKSRLKATQLPEDCGPAYVEVLESIYDIQEHTNSTVDVVQRRRGCSLSADGTVSGFEAWALNGMDFLTFDPGILKWTSRSPSARSVQQLWNQNNPKNFAFAHFIKHKCPLIMRKTALTTLSENTEMQIYAKSTSVMDEVQLKCHATSSDQSVASIRLIGDGAPKVSWVSVTAPLPGGDGSVVLRLTAGVSIRAGIHQYGCTVQTDRANITRFWIRLKSRRPPRPVDPRVLEQLTKLMEETHSLVFLSMGRVKSLGKYDFEQLTVYDGIIVSHCDGLTKKDKFKSNLQKSALPDSCEKAYVNIYEAIDNIQDRTNNTVDVVQRRRGCSRSSNGTISAFEVWAVNGNEFLTFDPFTLKWTSRSPSAFKIEELWDSQLIRSHDCSASLRYLCPQMIQQITLKSAPKNTELHVFAKPVEGSNEAFLWCHVTTTDPSVKSVRLIGDGAPRVSGFSVVGPLPSDGDARVLRLTARISLSHTQLTYGCAVQSEGHNISVFWNGNTLDGRHIYRSLWDKSLPATFGFMAVIAMILVISCLTIFLLNCIKMKRRPPPPPPRPELTEQFESFIQSSTLYPDIRNYLLSFIYGSNTPEHHRDNQNQWLEMMERQYDPEFCARRV